jgi:hypothetical protein
MAYAFLTEFYEGEAPSEQKDRILLFLDFSNF